jgi:hypothetical protein
MFIIVVTCLERRLWIARPVRRCGDGADSDVCCGNRQGPPIRTRRPPNILGTQVQILHPRRREKEMQVDKYQFNIPPLSRYATVTIVRTM